MNNEKKVALPNCCKTIISPKVKLLSVINQGNKKGELKINPNYYNSPNEAFFVKESDKQKKTALTSSSKWYYPIHQQ